MYQTMQSPAGLYLRKDWTFEVDGVTHGATVMWPERGAMRNPFKRMPYGARAFLDGREVRIGVATIPEALWFATLGPFEGMTRKTGGVFARARIGTHRVRMGVTLWEGRAPYLFVDRWDVGNGVILPEDFPWPMTERKYRSVQRARVVNLLCFGFVVLVIVALLITTSRPA